MAIKRLNFENLKELDGGMLGVVVDEAMANAVNDMKSRPNVTGARNIIIEISLTPTVLDRTGTLEQVEIGYGLKEKQPPRKSGKTTCGVKFNGDLYFNELSPKNPDQRTIDEATD